MTEEAPVLMLKQNKAKLFASRTKTAAPPKPPKPPGGSKTNSDDDCQCCCFSIKKR